MFEATVITQSGHVVLVSGLVLTIAYGSMLCLPGWNTPRGSSRLSQDQDRISKKFQNVSLGCLGRSSGRKPGKTREPSEDRQQLNRC